mmetsp:Transcript_68/g.135  ORF Transcript_68/g.135 Transcript_68/m.135 type:complete len:203 (+) Transcript_68:81-689(+)
MVFDSLLQRLLFLVTRLGESVFAGHQAVSVHFGSRLGFLPIFAYFDAPQSLSVVAVVSRALLTGDAVGHVDSVRAALEAGPVNSGDRRDGQRVLANSATIPGVSSMIVRVSCQAVPYYSFVYSWSFNNARAAFLFCPTPPRHENEHHSNQDASTDSNHLLLLGLLLLLVFPVARAALVPHAPACLGHGCLGRCCRGWCLLCG